MLEVLKNYSKNAREFHQSIVLPKPLVQPLCFTYKVYGGTPGAFRPVDWAVINL